jgi:hypothetical protein
METRRCDEGMVALARGGSPRRGLRRLSHTAPRTDGTPWIGTQNAD